MVFLTELVDEDEPEDIDGPNDDDPAEMPKEGKYNFEYNP